MEAAAWLVAEEMMRARFGEGRLADDRRLFDLWKRAATGAPLEDREALRSRFVPFVSTAFGTPDAPKHVDHAEGLVAEYVWYLLTLQQVDEGRTLRWIEPPSFYVNEPGGDGLVTYQISGNVLVFRLWEIKKHTGSGPLSHIVAGAYKQLGENGSKYIAKFSISPPTHDAEVAALYSRLVDLWVDHAGQAGAGVAVGTSERHTPQRCFSTMHNHFPELDAGGQLEGLIAVVEDFSTFAVMVRGFVWNALSV